MTKRLIIGLFTGVLMATMLPGVAVAKDKDDKSPCRDGGWTEWFREDGSAFADQGECVAYVAEGGTLAVPTKTAFETACVNESGTYQAPYEPASGFGPYQEGCYWTYALDYDTYSGYRDLFLPLCDSGSTTAGWDGYGWDNSFVACEYPGD